ncbi:MAG: enoyl-CoA hydratase [Alphaproteobacteria bacterium]|nr:enoyl-CoA hydratase [Alphaproteobacteria bacterium]
MAFENIIVEKKDGVALVTLNRPEAMNALCTPLMEELHDALEDFEHDDAVRVVVITGNEKAFAAGADIKEMAPRDFMDVYKADFITHKWERVTQCRKPVIAAVSGYALGGGCELAMMCDFILASETAKFGQPEVTLGTLPGIGGSQRLTRLVGRAKAMEMCLTGRMMDAAEAERSGLAARVIPAEGFMDEIMKTAQKIAGFSQVAVMMIKDAVNRVDETTLAEGVRYERQLFHASFGTADQKEGMAAFIEKRKPAFKDR